MINQENNLHILPWWMKILLYTTILLTTSWNIHISQTQSIYKTPFIPMKHHNKHHNSAQMQGKHMKQGICRSCCFKLIHDITEDPLLSWRHSLNWHTWHKYCVWSHLAEGKHVTEVGRSYRTLNPFLLSEHLKFVAHCQSCLMKQHTLFHNVW